MFATHWLKVWIPTFSPSFAECQLWPTPQHNSVLPAQPLFAYPMHNAVGQRQGSVNYFPHPQCHGQPDIQHQGSRISKPGQEVHHRSLPGQLPIQNCIFYWQIQFQYIYQINSFPWQEQQVLWLRWPSSLYAWWERTLPPQEHSCNLYPSQSKLQGLA